MPGILEQLIERIDFQDREIEKLRKRVANLSPDRVLTTADILSQLDIKSSTLRYGWPERWPFIKKEKGKYFCLQSELNDFVRQLKNTKDGL